MMELPQSNTFVYRTVHQPEPAGTLQLKVDVYSPPEATDNESPVLVYFHSGGLTAGSRQLNSWFPTWILDHALSLGFTFIIPDYTLLVPGNVHDLLEDVKVLTNWLHTDLNKALQGTGLRDVRTEDIVVVGQSAGGYLAYLMYTVDSYQSTTQSRCYLLRNGRRLFIGYARRAKKGKIPALGPIPD